MLQAVVSHGVRRMGKRQDRREREAALFAEPSTLDALCAIVADGGTLAEWCRGLDIRYSMAHDWLHADRDRLAAYSAALEARASQLTDRVVEGMRRMADVDPRKLYDSRGRLIPIPRLGDDIARSISAVDEVPQRNGTTLRKVRLIPQDRGVEMLGRHLGMFRDKLDVDLNVGLAERMRAARQRAAGGGSRK